MDHESLSSWLDTTFPKASSPLSFECVLPLGCDLIFLGMLSDSSLPKQDATHVSLTKFHNGWAGVGRRNLCQWEMRCAILSLSAVMTTHDKNLGFKLFDCHRKLYNLGPSMWVNCLPPSIPRISSYPPSLICYCILWPSFCHKKHLKAVYITEVSRYMLKFTVGPYLGIFL